jgi:hypothetical protein
MVCFGVVLVVFCCCRLFHGIICIALNTLGGIFDLLEAPISAYLDIIRSMLAQILNLYVYILLFELF